MGSDKYDAMTIEQLVIRMISGAGTETDGGVTIEAPVFNELKKRMEKFQTAA